MNNGTIEIRAIAMTPIIHSEGTSGNTSLVRTEELASGARVPFVSGNSVKGRFRRAVAEFALDAMGVRNELSKAEVDLLFSGGHLSKGGQAINLARAREIEEWIPGLSMLGYSAGNTMTESKVRFAHWHVVCAENEFRAPADLLDLPASRAGKLIGRGFGTRKDVGTSLLAAKFLQAGVAKALTEGKASALEEEFADKGDSAQMIYSFQAIKAGAHLWSRIQVRDLTQHEWAAFLGGMWRMTVERRQVGDDDTYVWHLGGKNAVGYGEVLVSLRGTVIPDIAPSVETAVVLQREDEGCVGDYVRYLRDNRNRILDVLRAAVK